MHCHFFLLKQFVTIFFLTGVFIALSNKCSPLFSTLGSFTQDLSLNQHCHECRGDLVKAGALSLTLVLSVVACFCRSEWYSNLASLPLSSKGMFTVPTLAVPSAGIRSHTKLSLVAMHLWRRKSVDLRRPSPGAPRLSDSWPRLHLPGSAHQLADGASESSLTQSLAATSHHT